MIEPLVELYGSVHSIPRGELRQALQTAYRRGQTTRGVVDETPYEAQLREVAFGEIDRRLALAGKLPAEYNDKIDAYLLRLWECVNASSMGTAVMLHSVDTLKEDQAEASRDLYTRGLRQIVRGLWAGETDMRQFFESMSSILRMRLRQAFLMGAKRVGITEDELTDAEKAEMERFPQKQYPYILGFGDYVEARSKANGGLLKSIEPRLAMWAARWTEAYDLGMVMTGKNQKAEWVISPQKESCGSCLKLNGKVKRMSYWFEKGILPQVPNASYLICRGFACGCMLSLTVAPASKGPLPKLP